MLAFNLRLCIPYLKSTPDIRAVASGDSILLDRETTPPWDGSLHLAERSSEKKKNFFFKER